KIRRFRSNGSGPTSMARCGPRWNSTSRAMPSILSTRFEAGSLRMKRGLSILLVSALSALPVAPADAATSTKKIAFSNNYAGNSWRQAMLKSFDAVAKKAIANKAVAAADIFTTPDTGVPTQAAQIQNLILQGYDAIVINAASP